MAPLPHDGWKSRKIIVGITSFVVVIGVATAALFVTRDGGAPVATFAEWTNVVQYLVPSVLVPLLASMSVDKLAESRRTK